MTAKRSKTIRYIFILFLYNLIIAIIAYATQEISTYYRFEYSKWSYIDWWIFISIYIFLAGLFLYLAPFYEECLDALLQRFLVWIRVKYSINITKLEAHLNELKEADRKDKLDISKKVKLIHSPSGSKLDMSKKEDIYAG